MKQINLKLFAAAFLAISCFLFLPLRAQFTQFGGPDRNGIYHETGLLDQWPEEGPELLATISGIGAGYAAPAVNENGVYIAGMIDTLGYVFHFDHNQKLLWKTLVGPEFNFKYVGSRATPTIEGNRLYYVASMGDAVCLDVSTGEKIWHMNIMQEYNGPAVKWGYTESPLIYNEKIFFTPGGPHQNFVALDKLTGKLIWKADADSTINSYCSPVLIKYNNQDVVLLNSKDYILLINAEDGKVLVKHPLTDNHYNHALPPIYDTGKLFYSSGYGEGTTLFRIVDGQYEMDTIYTNKDLDAKISGMIRYEGTVFGVSDKRRQWVGVDYESGETVFESRDLKAGSFILSDDKFFMYTEMGEVALAIPSKTGFEVVSRFQIPAGKATFAFAHPVLYEGILYIRYNENLWLYKVK